MDPTSIAILVTAVGGIITGVMAQLGARKAQDDDHWVDQNKQLFSNVDQVVQSLRDELDRVNAARHEDQRVAHEEIARYEERIAHFRALLAQHGIPVDDRGLPWGPETGPDQQ